MACRKTGGWRGYFFPGQQYGDGLGVEAAVPCVQPASSIGKSLSLTDEDPENAGRMLEGCCKVNDVFRACFPIAMGLLGFCGQIP